MAERERWSRFRLLLLGAAVLVTAGTLIALGFVWTTFRSYGEEFALQRHLDERFGSTAADLFEVTGAVAPARLSRFVEVRRRLQPLCQDVTSHQSSVRAVDDYRDDKPAEHEVMGLLTRVFDAGRRMPRMISGFTAYVTARNTALGQLGVGLPEYSALYTLVYVSWLGEAPSPLISRTRESVFERRVYPAVADLVARHLATAELAGAPEADLLPWRREAARLRDGAHRVPFAAGLPPALEASLRPQRPALAALSCPAAAELDVVRTEPRRLVGYDHR
ncbi:MAG: hypothetical protein MUF60_05575, partial [Vicinamibacterales bacterium]|nr:hypothetical protein [Vicinamibacterales bacterium]